MGEWGDSIKIGLKGLGWEILDWIALAQDKDKCPAPLITVKNLMVL